MGNYAIWGLRVGLNLFFLFLYLAFFKEKLCLIYRRMQSGYGLIACISSLTFVMMTFLTFYNEWQREKGADRAHQIRLMKMHEKALMARVEAYEKTERSARQTRHDFRHHNMVVMELAEQGDCEGILAYLKEYEQIEEEKFDRRYSKNPAVNSLITVYMRRARQCGIAMNADIRLDSPCPNDT